MGHGEKYNWAAHERNELGQKQRKQCWAARRVWAKRGEGKGGKEILLLIFQRSSQKIEFKQRFEFKQTKTMQQHVCNIKPL
jgi:hypothetical protein